MNRKRWKVASDGRMNPALLSVVAGILESSATLDEQAAKKREKEAKKFEILGALSEIPDGIRELTNSKKKEAINIPIEKSLSLGTMASAQVLAGLAAELALKYAYEDDNPERCAQRIHNLSDLFGSLSSERKKQIEEDYRIRVQEHSHNPASGWETAENAFQSAKDHFVKWRYMPQKLDEFHLEQPVWLREATASILATLGQNIK